MRSNTISVWGLSLPVENLTQAEVDYLSRLPVDLPMVDWVWDEMDRIWHYYKLDNRRSLSSQQIESFYCHPVWLMNGIFTATDSLSVSHRSIIADYIVSLGARSVADYGGGFGELARAITAASEIVAVSVIEPYSSTASSKRLQERSNIKYVPTLLPDSYDVVVVQDVLEHVEDPVGLSHDIACAVKKGGWVVFPNCFYPVIQAHLPCTFHLRHTFRFVMKALGLDYVGAIDGAPHALVFLSLGSHDLGKARKAERVSRLIGPILNQIIRVVVDIKCLVGRN